MQKDITKIEGPVFPIITPFTAEGLVDYVAVIKYIDFLCLAGAETLYVMAHASRVGLLRLEELVRLNDIVCSHTKSVYPDVTVIAAIPMYGGIAAAIHVAAVACIAGADLISVLFTERYYSNEQVVEFYTGIANNIHCGILVHEEPMNALAGCTKVQWPLSLLEKVVAIDKVVAIKEDSHEDAFTSQIVHRFKDEVSIIVSGGGKEQFFKFGPIGCQAYLVGVGSFAPEIALAFYDTYIYEYPMFSKKIIVDTEQPFFKVAMGMGWHIALKSAMEHMGIMKRYERMPLKMLNEEDHTKIGKLLIELDFKKGP